MFLEPKKKSQSLYSQHWARSQDLPRDMDNRTVTTYIFIVIKNERKENFIAQHAPYKIKIILAILPLVNFIDRDKVLNHLASFGIFLCSAKSSPDRKHV
jgi:hypothetical protein